MELAPTTRPLTKEEQDFYQTMKDHYQNRLAADPDNSFLKATSRTLSKIAKDGTIPTLEAIPGSGFTIR